MAGIPDRRVSQVVQEDFSDMSREWARTLVADETLREPVATLLRELPGEIHGDHLSAFPPEVRKLVRRFRRIPRAGARLSTDLSWLGMTVPPMLEADWQALSVGGVSRLALLPRKSLSELTRFAGAMVCRSMVAAVVRREEVAALLEFLGADAYRFMLRRAPFMHVPVGVSGEGADLPERVTGAGLKVLSACGRLMTPGLSARLALKLPRAYAEASEWTAGADIDRIWDWMKRMVIREALPSWTAIFN